MIKVKASLLLLVFKEQPEQEMEKIKNYLQ